MKADLPPRHPEDLDTTVYNQPAPDSSVLACPHCDLLQRLPEIAPGESARCPRCARSCGAAVKIRSTARWRWPLRHGALRGRESVPMLGLTVVGRQASTTVVGGAEHLWDNGQRDRRGVGALHRRHRPGAADRLHAGDCARCPADARATMGRDAAAPSPDHPHLEHDRGDAAWRAGRPDQDCRLRHGNSGHGAVCARGTGVPAGRDAGKLRSARSVGADRVGDGSAARNAALPA